VRTRDKIINATISLLLEKGFCDTRISEVMERSKISKGSLYYYFPEGKQQLCIECLRLFTLKLSLKYKKIFKSSDNLDQGLNKIIEYSKAEVIKSKYTKGSILINFSNGIDSYNKDLQKICEDLFSLIINTIESFFLQYNIENWQQSARVFFIKLNGAIVLSKACKTTIFFNDLNKEYSQIK